MARPLAAILAEMRESVVPCPLFMAGEFVLHSGGRTGFRIECDALQDADWVALAAWAVQLLPSFGAVEGVPRGGRKLADALAVHVTTGPLLIVDDVLSTGTCIEQWRSNREAIGLVVFARARPPAWVRWLFAMPGACAAWADEIEAATAPDLIARLTVAQKWMEAEAEDLGLIRRSGDACEECGALFSSSHVETCPALNAQRVAISVREAITALTAPQAANDVLQRTVNDQAARLTAQQAQIEALTRERDEAERRATALIGGLTPGVGVP